MNIQHQTSIWQDAATLHGQPAVGKRSHWRRRAPLLLGFVGTVIAILTAALFALTGIGMSAQPQQVVFNGALGSLFAIISSLVIIRRLLNFPLLRSYGYIALTFVSSFALAAIALKVFRIEFSAPQFFLAMVMITGLVDVFFYVSPQWAPMKIAIIPGAEPLPKLPTSLAGSFAFTMLSSAPTTNFNYSAVVADLSLDLESKWERFLALAALRGIPVYHVKQFKESITGRVAVDHLRENTLGAVLPSLIYPQFKRGIDLLAALVLLPFVGSILGLCAILIKLETAGPIFYRQRRAGFRGQEFTIFKLRTMRDNHGGEDFTGEADQRITRVGRFLRQYRIDELPQIINILRGEMSWIGPRPEATSLAHWYEREVPFYIYRHIVQPGITGWAQVHQGNVAEVDAARRKLEYDFYYIKNFSFCLDAVILIKTLRTIVTGFGSR